MEALQARRKLDISLVISALASFVLYWRAVYSDIFIAVLLLAFFVLAPLLITVLLSLLATLITH